MNRLIRIAKSKITARELIALAGAFLFAVLASSGVLGWYKSNGGNYGFIVAINEIGKADHLGHSKEDVDKIHDPNSANDGSGSFLLVSAADEALDGVMDASGAGLMGGQTLPSYLAGQTHMNTMYISGSRTVEYGSVEQNGAGQEGEMQENSDSLYIANADGNDVVGNGNGNGNGNEGNGGTSGADVDIQMNSPYYDRENGNGQNAKDDSYEETSKQVAAEDNRLKDNDAAHTGNDAYASADNGDNGNASNNAGDNANAGANGGSGNSGDGVNDSAGSNSAKDGTGGADGDGSGMNGGGVGSGNSDGGNAGSMANDAANKENASATSEKEPPKASEPEKAKSEKFDVRIKVDGVEKKLAITKMKAKDALAKAGISLSADDKLIGAKRDDMLTSDITLTIKRVTHKTTTEEKSIPAKTVHKDNASLLLGMTNVLANGKDGLKKIEYKIVYEDGVQVDKRLVKETVVREAVDKVVERGTANILKLSDNSEIKIKKAIDVKCTAYTSSYEDTGKKEGDPGYGVTKSGKKAQKGVVAVDPKVIPLGTKMYISILDDNIEDYGYCEAGDTGSKIKGNKVDLYFEADRKTLLEFGVRNARVYILE